MTTAEKYEATATYKPDLCSCPSYLPSGDREFLLAICDRCWDKMFPPEDDDE